MVTNQACAQHRDGALVGVQRLNADNNGRGAFLGFSSTRTLQFRFVSVVAGNSLHLRTDYNTRHQQVLELLLQTFRPHYTVGTCSGIASNEPQLAEQYETMLLAQVGPPGFYRNEPPNPWLFGYHLNSDDYPLHAVRRLLFQAQESVQPESFFQQQPIRVIYRNRSEFFFSTCQSALQSLRDAGFTATTTTDFSNPWTPKQSEKPSSLS